MRECGTPEGMLLISLYLDTPIIAGVFLYGYFNPPEWLINFGLGIVHVPSGALLSYDPCGLLFHKLMLPFAIILLISFVAATFCIIKRILHNEMG